MDVSDTSPDFQGDQITLSYEASFREAKAVDGSIYSPMSPMIQAAHERRIALLDQLPIGTLSGKTVVDYGVGSWGFACIYPRLQHCAHAIGIDISNEAIKESIEISAKGQFPYGSNFEYFTARGDNIPLDDASVDVFFTGECIEHVENTVAFLDEIHRVLKPGGMLILTTPNADAYVFRIQSERYGVGPEHVALMGYNELAEYVRPRFDIVQAHGFNGSLHYSIDTQIQDPVFAQSWAAQFADRPDLGTGIVLMARRNDAYQGSRYQQQYYHQTSPEIKYTGSWEAMPLHKAIMGRGGSAAQDAFELTFNGEGLILNFWAHAWSGVAEITVDHEMRKVDLFSPQGGFERVLFSDLPHGAHTLRVRVTGDRDPRSQGQQVIFYQAISYLRLPR